MAASKHFTMHSNDHVKENESGKERAAFGGNHLGNRLTESSNNLAGGEVFQE